MAREFKVFVSHSWSYLAALNEIREMLKTRGYFNVEFEEATPTEPINSENATYIKRKLKERILDSNIVLGIAGIYASYSDWMAWELETAFRNSIPIVGIIPRDNVRVSATVTQYAKEIIVWNTEEIVAAIRRWANR